MTGTVLRMPHGVLYVAPDMRFGGAERHVATLLPALDRSRFRPSLCCLSGGGPMLAPIEAAGIPVLDLGVRGRAALPGALVALVRHLRRTRPDVVMCHGTTAGLLARLAARAACVPAVIAWKHNVGHLGRHGATERIVERLVGGATTRWFGVSFAQVRYLTDHLGVDPERVRVIYNAVDAGPAPPPPPDADTVTIVSVAVLREEKGHGDLLEAFRQVAAVRPAARLALAGDGPLRDELAARVAAAGLGDRVELLGARSDVDAVLAGSDIVALASVTVENFPYAILEAMAAARPVVCTAVGGLPELVEDGITGHLVPARAPGALAQRLLALIDDPEGSVRMGAAGRERVRTRFTVAAQAARVESELLEALDGAVSRSRSSS
jgi:glycosyltransferase involved in cell wall biosynthesis